jgi:hypothetical protein
MRISLIGHVNFVKAFLIALCLAGTFGCGANDNILKSGKGPARQANPTPVKTSFETDLEAMRTAGFSFIYVLRRKDGGVIDPEDKSVIRVQTTQANRRVSADEGKAVIVGSNFQIAPHNMAAIYQRFAVDNYSPAPSSGTEPLPADNQNMNR